VGRPSSRVGSGAVLLLLAWASPLAALDPLNLARFSLVERDVEVRAPGAGWRLATEGGPLFLGEALRTGGNAVTRLELPWMALGVGPGASLLFPDRFLLQAVLEEGRVVVETRGRDALTLVTDEAELRGQGHAVVRRQGTVTLVTCLAGRFFVSSRTTTSELTAGRGMVVTQGRRPAAPVALPPPPSDGLWPGRDPVYVAPGAPLELRWPGGAAGYVIEVLPVGSDVVLIQKDASRPPATVAIPWEGAFRWRVSARDASGLESPPSPEGLVAVASSSN
jgi:hypothetical protein